MNREEDDILGEVSRRLRVLEGALGIDLDSTCECSGDPLNCGANPCNQERCPMANSYVQQLLNHTNVTEERITLLMAFMEELEDQGIIPRKVIRLAKARIASDVAIEEVALLDRRLGMVLNQHCSTQNALKAQLVVARSEQAGLQNKYYRLRQEVKDALQAHQDD